VHNFVHKKNLYSAQCAQFCAQKNNSAQFCAQIAQFCAQKIIVHNSVHKKNCITSMIYLTTE